MPTFSRFPTNAEAADHAAKYPFVMTAGLVRPYTAGVWFLRHRTGMVEMVFITSDPNGHRPKIWTYGEDMGGFMFRGDSTDQNTVILAMAMDPATGRDVD
jgi:hypothetical protein